MIFVLGMFLVSLVTAECVENWDCTNWGECIDEQQTRTCVDSNSCGTIVNKPDTTQSCTTQEEETQEVCCHIYGLGAYMKKVNSKYQWMEEVDCITPEDFVGGGREIVDNKFCIVKKIIQARNKIRANAQAGECPDNCTCTGSVMKCELENGGRQMTITAGKSGNIIVQVKGVNMSTNVTLYKSEGKVYGVFKNNQTRIIKIMPDEVKEKIRAKIKAKLQDEEIELDEDGVYQVQAKKKARLFFILPVREKVKAQIHSETGEIIKIRNPWWGFLARDVEEELEQETEG